jgi:S1-C subfamily serine protease
MFCLSSLLGFSALQRLSFHWRRHRDIFGFYILALFCSGGTVIPTDALAGNQTQYIIDGLALGAPVAPKSATYREYKCHPSEQFASFVWCQRVRTEQSKFGDVKSTNSILHSEIGATAYVSQYIDPAFFGPGDLKREIERLSQRFGSSPHILRSPRRPNEPEEGVIAYWGDVTLTPLDSRSLAQLAAGQSVTKGMLFDFLGNFGDSAREGFPIFQLGGARGYVWGAHFDESGKGSLRMTAIDATQFTPPSLVARVDFRFSLEQCGKSKEPAVKVEHCSVVISQSSDGKILERAFNRRGLAYMDLNRFAEAANDFTSVIRLNPRIAGYYDNRQNAYRAMGRLQEALNDANKAIRLAPTYSFVYVGQGNVFADMGQYDLAIEDYTKAISLDSGNAGLFVDRGKIFAKSGQLSKAVADFTHALDMDVGMTVALRERGLAYKLLGNIDAARTDLNLFLRLRPEDREIVQALQELQEPNNEGRSATPHAPTPDSKPQVGWSSGTGFFVSKAGHVLTNNHVIERCTSFRVFVPQSEPVDAREIASDTTNDLALLSTGLRPPSVATPRWGSRVGEFVAAFGYPHPDLLATSGNFTQGNVTALAGIDDDSRYLQISTPVQAGNSGGPLLDQNGNLVGMVTAKLDAFKMEQERGDLPQNVNFALKASIIASFLDINGIKYTLGSATSALKPEELADQAKAMSVFILCK